MEASRPWLCYWALHSLSLLGEVFDGKLANRYITLLFVFIYLDDYHFSIIAFLKTCEVETGGYGGESIYNNYGNRLFLF
jgi:protein farnesyltransferase subunit beta